MNFFLYIRSFFITIMVIITLYYLILHITYYNIINEYKRVTNGTIKMDKRGRYVGDHYLSTDSFHNSDKHIHIWMEYEYGICCIKYILYSICHTHIPSIYVYVYRYYEMNLLINNDLRHSVLFYPFL